MNYKKSSEISYPLVYKLSTTHFCEKVDNPSMTQQVLSLAGDGSCR